MSDDHVITVGEARAFGWGMIVGGVGVLVIFAVAGFLGLLASMA